MEGVGIRLRVGAQNGVHARFEKSALHASCGAEADESENEPKGGIDQQQEEGQFQPRQHCAPDAGSDRSHIAGVHVLLFVRIVVLVHDSYRRQSILHIGVGPPLATCS